MSQERRDLGISGEKEAESFLRKLRYTIVDRNYRCALGEVDLIALDGSTIVFVEVKTRRHALSGSPFEAVNRRKQRQIQRAAQYYLNQHRLQHRDARFDVVGVWQDGDAVRCELIKNAFELTR